VTDLQPAGEPGTDLVVLPTGELISLDDTAACAVALDELRTLEQRVKEIKKTLIDAIDKGVTSAGRGRTLHLPTGVTVVSKKNVDVLWDAQQLEDDLREAGMSEERIREIVIEEVSYTVRAAEAKKAASVNPEYAQAVAASRREIKKRASISVKRP
jgi:hypothetical protein